MNRCGGYWDILPNRALFAPKTRCELQQEELASIGLELHRARKLIEKQRQQIEALHKKANGLELTLQAERELRKTENIET